MKRVIGVNRDIAPTQQRRKFAEQIEFRNRSGCDLPQSVQFGFLNKHMFDDACHLCGRHARIDSSRKSTDRTLLCQKPLDQTLLARELQTDD